MQINMNDLISTAISGLALAVSVLSAAFSFRLQRLDSRRSTREQLNETVSELIRLNAENNSMWFIPSEQRDAGYYQKQGSLAQTAVAVSRQAAYLAEQQPDLVTDIEFLTIAQGLVMAGDFATADGYWQKAVNASPNAYYRVVNTRMYADFLFNQGKHESGRTLYKQALTILDDLPDTDYRKYTNGYTCQMWMVSEANHRFWEEADVAFDRARRLFEKISNPYAVQNGLSGLRQAKEGSYSLRVGDRTQTGSPIPTPGGQVQPMANFKSMGDHPMTGIADATTPQKDT